METIERWKEAADTIGWVEKASLHSISPRIDWISSSGLDQLNGIGAVGGWWQLPESASQLEDCSPLSAERQHHQNIAPDQSLCSNNTFVRQIQIGSGYGNNLKRLQYRSFYWTHRTVADWLWWRGKRLRKPIFFFFTDFVVSSEAHRAANKAEAEVQKGCLSWSFLFLPLQTL